MSEAQFLNSGSRVNDAKKKKKQFYVTRSVDTGEDAGTLGGGK